MIIAKLAATLWRVKYSIIDRTLLDILFCFFVGDVRFNTLFVPTIYLYDFMNIFVIVSSAKDKFEPLIGQISQLHIPDYAKVRAYLC